MMGIKNLLAAFHTLKCLQMMIQVSKGSAYSFYLLTATLPSVIVSKAEAVPTLIDALPVDAITINIS